jgi:hypothetical protein
MDRPHTVVQARETWHSTRLEVTTSRDNLALSVAFAVLGPAGARPKAQLWHVSRAEFTSVQGCRWQVLHAHDGAAAAESADHVEGPQVCSPHDRSQQDDPRQA